MDTMMPLVSVCVITYNSSKTVQQTLDSISAQTYPCLELVISDDCSSDETVSLCQEWLTNNSSRFVHTQVIARKENGGIGKNYNTAISASSGEWIKIIAGDDLLLPNCIADNVCFIGQHPQVDIVFSKVRVFHQEGNRIVEEKELLPDSQSEACFMLSAEEQFRELMYKAFVPAVSSFFKRTLMIVHPMPENYPYCEDWPQWIRLTGMGIQLFYFNTITVLYRKDGNSLSSRVSGSRFINPRYHNSLKAVFYSERYPYLIKRDPEYAKTQQGEYFLGDLALLLLGNRNNLFSRTIIHYLKKKLHTKYIQ